MSGGVTTNYENRSSQEFPQQSSFPQEMGKNLQDKWIEQGNPGWRDLYGAIRA
jgi:hypothetical protein